ncbi:3-phosphoshikimate 1-carboxyvinyltransferase [candidate division FCPU426 bacterium]|nr:3-phosphoshikimate 1-carboxyvinyltransferase [candidate division FCPU426 bacterium]
MNTIKIDPVKKIEGTLAVPGDKSISHRAAILGTLAAGETHVANFLTAADCMNTVHACRQLGADIEQAGTSLRIRGCGGLGLKKPSRIIDCGNSGTGVRLLAGVLAGQAFSSVLTGDDQVRRRPMRRIVEPLELMGATIKSRPGYLCPLEIQGRPLHAVHYQVPVASAQVKSCLLLAGLFAEGKTHITLPSLSRDHTERMLAYFGADISRPGNSTPMEAHWAATAKEEVAVQGRTPLQGRKVEVPADISSAAFFMVAAAVLPGSYLRLANVGINPTRTGVVEVLQRMGADIVFGPTRMYSGEPVADIIVKGTRSLRGRPICGEDLIPRLIDELPILAVAAAAAEGETVIEDAAELRVKETDRIGALAEELRKIGIEVEERPDGMVIQGGEIRGGQADSHGDHRLAMSLAIAGLFSEDGVEILHADCVKTSFPGFWECLQSVSA